MEGVVYLDGKRWRTRAEMAEYLDVSERTVTRRVNRGEIVRRERPNGNLYRLAEEGDETARDSETGHETGQDRTPRNPSTQADEPGTTRHPRDTRRDRTGQHETPPAAPLLERLIDRLDAKGDRLADLTGQLERTRAELEAAQEDRRRLLEYVEAADAEHAELGEQLEALQADVNTHRARVHLERGRRELAEERLTDAHAEIARLRAELTEGRRTTPTEERPAWWPFGNAKKS